MGLWENINLAIAGLRASKMRALLTMLGIIIGIGSVIAIVTIGNSLTQSVTGVMNDMGANSVEVMLQQRESNRNVKIEDKDRITEQMIEQIQQRYGDDIAHIFLQTGGGGGQVKDGRRYANVNITGINDGAVKALPNQYELLKGRDISDKDVKGAKNTVMVSDKFVEKMFNEGSDPLGKEIKVYTGQGMYTYAIVGVYKFKMPAMLASFVSEEDMSTDIIVPVTTVKKQNGEPDGYTRFTVLAAPGVDTYKLADNVQALMDTFYEKNKQFTVFTYNNESMMEQVTTMMSTISIAISIIAAISLLVGGIGVMNIMLVSVTERTREIGTRKALGARNSAIKAQFIVEAMIICLIGGLIGIAFGLGLGALGGLLLNFPASPSVPAILFAVGFSMAIGVFFGYYPASKAAKLDPIEALRYE